MPAMIHDCDFCETLGTLPGRFTVKWCAFSEVLLIDCGGGQETVAIERPSADAPSATGRALALALALAKGKPSIEAPWRFAAEDAGDVRKASVFIPAIIVANVGEFPPIDPSALQRIMPEVMGELASREFSDQAEFDAAMSALVMEQWRQ